MGFVISGIVSGRLRDSTPYDLVVCLSTAALEIFNGRVPRDLSNGDLRL